MEFKKSYSLLNTEQKAAVDSIEGPLLVIAGPGTGKTQLLTTRVANILQKTDTDPSEILCLTFTESGASNMKNRLNNMIGRESYNVNINTYHGFGNELIKQYYDYFPNFRITKPAEELTLDKIVRQIQTELPYGNPLKNDIFLRSIKTMISNSKREFISPDILLAQSRSNLIYLHVIDKKLESIFTGFKRVDKKAIDYFKRLLVFILDTKKDEYMLSDILAQDLKNAITEFEISGSTKHLTKWKDKWLEKNSDNLFTFKAINQNIKMEALADIYSKYEKKLQDQGIYDYDDMIGLTLTALENNDEFRFNVQEKYQYILLDEFQDTNGSQFKLVELLTSNPIFEGRPNILAVGDDDQAIYSFQGANYSHMRHFYGLYRGVKIITLVDNYRSNKSILDLASSVSMQINERLTLPGQTEKHLVSKKKHDRDVLKRIDFRSDISQYAYVANQIKKLLASGIPGNEIAIIARKHKYLTHIVPFLHKQDIKLRYDKKENILDDPAINLLISMAKLVLALKDHKRSELDELWPEILSAEFYNLPTSLIWNISWQAHDSRISWREILIDNPATKNICLFYYRLSLMVDDETLETMLDYLVGINELDIKEDTLVKMKSGFYDYHFSEKAETESTLSFWELLNNLTVLRQHLRDFSDNHDGNLKLKDFIEYIQDIRSSELRITNNSPLIESDDAVFLSTAHSVKGLEFKTVFILDALESVWGSKSKDSSDKISAPPGLESLRSIGTNEDERIRLFYVAITRASEQLIITSYSKTGNNKSTIKLQYLGEYEDDKGQVISPYLTGNDKIIDIIEASTPSMDDIVSYWQRRHVEFGSDISLKTLLADRLESFKLSPTNLNKFTNVAYGGPRDFFIDSLLRFPKAKAPIAEYGTAIHKSIEWLQKTYALEKEKPTIESLLDYFHKQMITKDIEEKEKLRLEERGIGHLKTYLNQIDFHEGQLVLAEVSFARENVLIGDALISGNIDKLIIDPKRKTITVVDYKTGKSYTKWKPEIKLHNYERQLYFYKLLIENSTTYKKYKVVDAYLEFVEATNDGKVNKLHINFDDKTQQETADLIKSIYSHIKKLELPDIAIYPDTLAGIKKFEQYLIDNK